MARFQVGDVVMIEGRRAKVVWIYENPNEFEAIDEYIVEYDNHQRRFCTATDLSMNSPLSPARLAG